MDTRQDYLHDHETLGFRRGCVACAQVTADLMISGRVYRESVASASDGYEGGWNAAHPDDGSGLVRIPITTQPLSPESGVVLLVGKITVTRGTHQAHRLF